VAFDPDLLARARDYAARMQSTAVIVQQRGETVAQWGEMARPTDIASGRKSLLSALIGIAVAEGRLRLDDTLAALGIDESAAPLSDAEKRATVADLLTSRSGVYRPVDLEPPAVAAARPARGSHPPGSFWYYNNWDFNALGTIYERATGASVFDAFERLVARPVGMQDFRAADCAYGETKLSQHRHYGFRVSPRDLARFGELYLRGGAWDGRQVVPADWVAESVRPHARLHSPIFSGRGYGYMWWSGFASDFVPIVTLPEGSFYALGFGGQYLLVIPAHDLVIVHTNDLERPDRHLIDDFRIGRLVWLILSAAGIDAGPDTSFATAPGERLAGDALRAALAGRALRFAEAAPDGPYVMRLAADGVATLEKGAERQLALTGKWWVDGNRLCRGWDRDAPRFGSWPVLIDGDHVGLYEANGTMFLRGMTEAVKAR
jgi:CubicO group peptidase (beta-lactamase class C family)